MELEWDEDKRQATLRHRALDFADVERFDPDSIVTVPDLRATMERIVSTPMEGLMAVSAVFAGHREKAGFELYR